jgi:hypothetical protein
MKISFSVARSAFIGIPALAAVLALAGCASVPEKVDTSASAYKVARTAAAGATTVSAIVIANKAEDGVYKRDGLLGEVRFPFNVDPKPKQLVERDLQEFFSQAVKSDPNSGTRIVVTLKRVDCYLSVPGIHFAPIIGFAFIGVKNPMVMEISALVEVEEGGRVTRSYLLEKKTVLNDGHGAYRELIAAYRQEVFQELERDFVERYL